MARLEPRITKHIPVRLFGLDGTGRPFHKPAWTLDLSPHGLRVKGVYCWNYPGEIIGVRCGTQKARYRVVWIGKKNTLFEQQVGLYCVEPNKRLWDLVLLQPKSTGSEQRSVEIPSEPPPLSIGEIPGDRRGAPRYHTTGRAQVREIGRAAWSWSMLSDISRSGCYLEMPNPIAEGALVEANLNAAAVQWNIRGEVRACHPFVGMAVQFTELIQLSQQRLEQVLAVLAQRQRRG
jgi:hypothetical protein